MENQFDQIENLRLRKKFIQEYLSGHFEIPENVTFEKMKTEYELSKQKLDVVERVKLDTSL